MKRELHFASMIKYALLLAVVFVASTTTSFAGDLEYNDYFANLKAYPTGAGLVYADADDTNLNEDQAGLPFSENMTTPADEVEVKFIYEYGNTAYFTAHAVPANGWIFAGFSGCKKDADDNHIFNDSIVSRENPASLMLTSNTSNTDLTTAEQMFPLVADTTIYALFTHVATSVCEGHDSLGSVSISKVCNDLGDDITLTANVRDAEHTQFDYWIKEETGEKIAQNPLNVKVNETAHYNAHFTSSLADVVNFPEEGGLIIYHSNYDVNLPTSVKMLTFNYTEGEYGDSVKFNDKKEMFYQVPDTSGYYAYAGCTYILQGKGEQTFFHFGQDGNIYDTSYFQWAGDEALNVADLAATSHYYTINLEKQQFELLTDDATIPAGTAYWALPNERYEALGVMQAPAVIYWNDPDVSAGISSVSADRKSAAKGIYNLQGQKLSKMTGKGLYIVDGKKIFNLAK